MRGLLAMTAVLGALFAAVGPSQAPITRTLGKPQAEFAEPFTEIGAIRELRDGRLIVVDARELTVKLRLDEDDLQYLQRHPLPTTARP